MAQLIASYLQRAGALILLLGLLQAPVALSGERTSGPVLHSIEQLEIAGGAYNTDLGEQLLSLGQTYYTEKNFPAAISALKRSAFISRVNNGLNNPMQIPIIESLIDAHIAAGQYLKADDRQHYLYRLKSINYKDDQQQTIQALLDFAEWQRQAYLLNLGKRSNQRLLMMHDAYQQAIQILNLNNEAQSKAMFAALEGLMSAQYLLSVYRGQEPESFQISTQTTSGEFSNPLDNHMEFLHTSAFKQGNIILSRLHTLHTNDAGASALAPVENTIATGDWYLWYNKRATAIKLYKDAYHKLLALEDAETHIQRLFGSPVKLPAIKSTESELLDLKRYREDDSGRFLVSYNVSEMGKTFKLEVIQTEPEGKSRRRSKIVRELKTRRFRPRFEHGEAVATKNIVEEYAY